MSKGLEALKRLINNKVFISLGRTHGKKQFANDINIIEKELKALEILKIFGFEIEDYTEDEHGSIKVKRNRIILDDEEIDIAKEVLL